MSTVESDCFFKEIERKGDCVDSIALLIKQGMDINTEFKATINGKDTIQSLLTYACHQNCTKIAKLLIDRGANVNYKSSPGEDTPMHIACKKHNKEIASSLLQIPSINLNSLNKDSEPCFSIALRTSQIETYSLIIKAISAQKGKATKEERNTFNIKDYQKAFKCGKIKEKIEIPFSFKGMDIACANSLNGIIKLTQRPSLVIDLDSLEKTEKMGNDNLAFRERVASLEKELLLLSKENQLLKAEINELHSLLKTSKEEIAALKLNYSTQEESQKMNDFDQLNSSINYDNYLQMKFQPNSHTFANIKACLQKDLIDYKNYIKLNINKTKECADQLVYQIQYAIDEIASNYEVKLYGSRATQLCLIWSDLDVVLTQKTQEKENDRMWSPIKSQVEPSHFMDLLTATLTAKLWVSSLKYISTASVPIIKVIATEKYSSMQIDISIQSPKHCGLKCVDLVNSYVNEFSALEPLVLAIKTLLKLSSLNDPFTGGLSSYGVILMIVAFLRREKAMNRPISLENVGELLSGFLLHYGGKHYSNCVNASTVAIVFNPASPSELIIVDPLNMSNNVGKSTFQYFNIKIAFLIALQALWEDCPCGCHYTSITNASQQGEGIQHNALRKMFNAVKRLVQYNN